MILLDTNIISEIARADGAAAVLDWAASMSANQFYLCAPVVAEMEYGAKLFLRRTGSNKHVNVVETIVLKTYLGRILPMNLEAARLAGDFKAAREAVGRKVASTDMYIAGIAAANNATLATRNIRDFEGLDLKLVNPFEG